MWGPRAEPRNFAPLTSRPPGMRNRHVSLCAIGPAANHPRLPFRPRRSDHPDRQGPRPGLEAGLRRIPPDPRATCLRPMHDYDDYVDGKPRTDGVRSFLESRHLTVPDEAVEDMAERKHRLFLDLIHRHGVQTYDGTVRYVHSARAAGLKVAVVSSSKHTTDVLRAAKLDGLFDGQ